MRILDRLGLALMVGVLSSAARAALDPFEETHQTLMETQGECLLALGNAFGPDPLSPLDFTTVVNGDALSFSFATLAGTTYLGQATAIQGSGSRGADGAWSWAFSGNFGTHTWSGTGGGAWLGDPEMEIDTTIEIDGAVYTIKGKATVTPDLSGNGNDTSTHSVTITGPANGPFGPGPFGPYAGTDERKRELTIGPFKWRYKLPVGRNPVVPDEVLYFTQGTQPDGSGPQTGTFQTLITPVPEPALTPVLALGALGLLRRRRRRDP